MLIAIVDLPRRLGALRARAEHDASSSSSAAIQGLGAGGLFPLSLAVIGGIVPPRDRGRWQGLIGAVFAASSIIGPARRRVHRRQHDLALDLPRQPAGRRRRARRDLVDDAEARPSAPSTRSTGSAPGCSPPARRRCCSGSSGAAATTRGASGHVLGALGAAAVVLAVFALVERRAREPILPVRAAAQPDRRRQRRLHGARRDGDVRDDLVRAALRAGRDRHLGDVVGRRPDAADARRGRRRRSSPASSSREPGATAGTSSSARSCCAPGWRSSGGWTSHTTNGEAARNMVDRRASGSAR